MNTVLKWMALLAGIIFLGLIVALGPRASGGNIMNDDGRLTRDEIRKAQAIVDAAWAKMTKENPGASPELLTRSLERSVTKDPALLNAVATVIVHKESIRDLN